ncbi:bifunctional phosphoribosyl-AMP cyclohydrolase/phosphoribosyl-ATP diphosphatase HisIE [Ferroplasma acidiphilum]|jgi:phosphoribosyl-ATP pyrophosphohydrolase/phosphoribosyl-AMP cyclohydrolase|uniref:bifunctional phosphoribosyl-AMP cyclohydrolase/phosphoribosyl-ATP diphosphatase HisIE n=1 Tax=Ferroplasma acidiphilum TaxID=74969 RepID=UPI0023F34740|nr:bifunctional phosphoribosyl-AMP cyclohydrolase/phosphoribosyl-ATP diphosphatase HisIE [Ferroplasma acidiphilum]MCL4349012.1 bifunctional phosphoribosyl-AMP cyclohydrolase/phosphoribosyl-ATP diphosphatase HisIE [Candidatus Thermoplasmatota archaeon]
MSDYDLKFEGLMPVVVQDSETKEVLTLAYMDEEAYRKSMETGLMHYYSRSKQRVRMKGEASGNIQEIKDVMIDCDNDSLLFMVKQKGAACHLGTKSCFREIGTPVVAGNINYSLEVLLELESLIAKTKNTPRKNSYTTELFESGEENIKKKVGEEAVESILAQGKDRIVYETADLLYHLLVFLSYENIKLSDIMDELSKRRKN